MVRVVKLVNPPAMIDISVLQNASIPSQVFRLRGLDDY